VLGTAGLYASMRNYAATKETVGLVETTTPEEGPKVTPTLAESLETPSTDSFERPAILGPRSPAGKL